MHIMIVEDERESREGLGAMLLRLAPTAQTWLAACGDEAMRLLADHPVDLIFLDIRMPGMDGLTLLGEIRRRAPSVAVAILSAYDQFSYAQKAIRLGAIDYITKPYTEQAIRQVVERVQEGMEPGGQGNAIFLPLDFSGLMTNPAMCAQVLAGRLNLPSDAKLPGRLYLFRITPEGEALSQETQRKIMAWLLREIEALLPPEGRALLLESEGMYPLAVFSREAPVEQEALACRLEEARARFGARICCAAGAPEADLLRSIRASLAHCKALLEYSFYLPPPCVIADGGLQTDAGKRVNRGLLEEMRSSVFRGDPAAAACAVEAVRREAQTPPYMPVQRLLYTLHAEWVNMADAAKLQDAQHMELAERAAAASQRSRDIDAFFSAYCALAVELAQAVRELSAHAASAPIERCLAYLSEHFSDPQLTQEAMARKLHFSAGYFGNLFKQAQGESFVRYLNRLRISKAQELLAASDLRVYEVAEQTGFANVNYFIRVFNQHTQMSPNRYRMLYAARRDEK
ncbi:response regulator [Beduinella massiliensis]|uniref:response regulator n=1 Tax=Beduinella massiliensis TaxID=1852363 RepID=UPI000C82975E